MSNKKSFILHYDSLEILEKLSDEQAGKLFKAMATFNIKGELPKLDFALELAFAPFKNQFIRDNEKYDLKVEKNRQNALKRWSGEINENKQSNANACERKQMHANYAYSDNESKNDNKNNSKNDNVNENYTNGIYADREFQEFLNEFDNNSWFEDVAMKLSITPVKIKELSTEFINDRSLDGAYKEQSTGQIRNWFVNFAKRNKEQPSKDETPESRAKRLMNLAKD